MINLAIGNFDGLHTAYQKYLKELSLKDKKLVVIKGREMPCLNTDKEVGEYLESLNLPYILLKEKDDKKIYDFCVNHFGPCELFETEDIKDEAVTSDLIKKYLKEDFNKAIELMNHDYLLEGLVVKGKGQGHLYNMPTANLETGKQKEMPKEGVYASIVLLDNKKYPAVTNIGLRPSADNDSRVTIETYISNFHEDIYGKELDLYLHSYLRGIIKFPDGLKGVYNQVKKDEKKALKELKGLY